MGWSREEQIYDLEKKGTAVGVGEERKCYMDCRRKEQLYWLE